MTPKYVAALREVFLEAIAQSSPRLATARAVAPASGATRIGVAVGKAATAMANGIGEVDRGIAVGPSAGGALPRGWQWMTASHPVPDERSVAAGEAVLALMAGTTVQDEVLFGISGGASALIEVPRTTLAESVAAARAAMAAGRPIAEVNAVRRAWSRIKGGQLAAATPARVTTFVASDVAGDDVAVVGSGPTFGGKAGDHVVLVAGIRTVRDAVLRALSRRRIMTSQMEPALEGDVDACAQRVREQYEWHLEDTYDDPQGEPFEDEHGLVHPAVVAYGEPTVTIPPGSGEGGRMQQMALVLARAMHGSRSVALCAGSDGIDGPPPRSRPAPAGAIVDGSTWGAIRAAGIDPDRALARRDAGTALAAVDALLVIGSTGVNHADVVVLV